MRSGYQSRALRLAGGKDQNLSWTPLQPPPDAKHEQASQVRWSEYPVYQISLPGFGIDAPRTVVDWDGDLGMSQFRCRAPLNPEETRYAGVVTFRVDDVIVGTTHFLVEIGPHAGSRTQLSTEARIINSAFASYSTEDRQAVLARIQGIQKAVPFMDIFLDVISLRSGDNWRQVIRDAIVARDVLFLFWSQSARASAYVEWEWQTALKENGIDRIEPIPLVSPEVAPPPAELQALHFNDWTLAVSRASSPR